MAAFRGAESGGDQRVPISTLRSWEDLRYGMFLHFGMSTYDGDELSPGTADPSLFAPTSLDVDQWVSVARDAGMRYAVLTAKHVSGFCLWPSRHTDYHVGASSVRTDVVERFVRACEDKGLRAGLYYCSWDNHHRFGSANPSQLAFGKAWVSAEYLDFQLRQTEELLTQYGPLVEIWIDIPQILGPEGRRKQYDHAVRLQPECLVMMNTGLGDGTHWRSDTHWPSDLVAIERQLPHSDGGYHPWHPVDQGHTQHHVRNGHRWTHRWEPNTPLNVYLPGEVCDPIGMSWFYEAEDRPRPPLELLGMRAICHERGTNLLLNVPPSPAGILEPVYVDALQRLRRDWEQVTA